MNEWKNMAKPLKQYEVTARMLILASITINAESLEDAVEQSKDMKEIDFIKFKGIFMDGSIRISGVSRTNYWDTEQED